MNREAIILAGGLGTRLQHLIPDLPKPMAPVNNKPFLFYILEELNHHSFKHVVLSIGYKADSITNYFGTQFKNIKLTYSFEETPLGTGGAIKKSLALTYSDSVFVINGDTFFKVDFSGMEVQHQNQKGTVTLAAKPLNNFDRYGTLTIKGDRIIAFHEKKYTQQGLINGGIYLLNKSLLPISSWPETFSFEKDFLETGFHRNRFIAYLSEGYFIDIGIPEDYAQANLDFKNRLL